MEMVTEKELIGSMIKNMQTTFHEIALQNNSDFVNQIYEKYDRSGEFYYLGESLVFFQQEEANEAETANVQSLKVDFLVHLLLQMKLIQENDICMLKGQSLLLRQLFRNNVSVNPKVGDLLLSETNTRKPSVTMSEPKMQVLQEIIHEYLFKKETQETKTSTVSPKEGEQKGIVLQRVRERLYEQIGEKKRLQWITSNGKVSQNVGKEIIFLQSINSIRKGFQPTLTKNYNQIQTEEKHIGLQTSQMQNRSGRDKVIETALSRFYSFSNEYPQFVYQELFPSNVSTDLWNMQHKDTIQQSLHYNKEQMRLYRKYQIVNVNQEIKRLEAYVSTSVRKERNMLSRFLNSNPITVINQMVRNHKRQNFRFDIIDQLTDEQKSQYLIETLNTYIHTASSASMEQLIHVMERQVPLTEEMNTKLTVENKISSEQHNQTMIEQESILWRQLIEQLQKIIALQNNIEIGSIVESSDNSIKNDRLLINTQQYGSGEKHNESKIRVQETVKEQKAIQEHRYIENNAIKIVTERYGVLKEGEKEKLLKVLCRDQTFYHLFVSVLPEKYQRNESGYITEQDIINQPTEQEVVNQSTVKEELIPSTVSLHNISTISEFITQKNTLGEYSTISQTSEMIYREKTENQNLDYEEESGSVLIQRLRNLFYNQSSTTQIQLLRLMKECQILSERYEEIQIKPQSIWEHSRITVLPDRETYYVEKLQDSFIKVDGKWTLRKRNIMLQTLQHSVEAPQLQKQFSVLKSDIRLWKFQTESENTSSSKQIIETSKADHEIRSVELTNLEPVQHQEESASKDTKEKKAESIHQETVKQKTIQNLMKAEGQQIQILHRKIIEEEQEKTISEQLHQKNIELEEQKQTLKEQIQQSELALEEQRKHIEETLHWHNTELERQTQHDQTQMTGQNIQQSPKPMTLVSRNIQSLNQEKQETVNVESKITQIRETPASYLELIEDEKLIFSEKTEAIKVEELRNQFAQQVMKQIFHQRVSESAKRAGQFITSKLENQIRMLQRKEETRSSKAVLQQSVSGTVLEALIMDMFQRGNENQTVRIVSNIGVARNSIIKNYIMQSDLIRDNLIRDSITREKSLREQMQRETKVELNINRDIRIKNHTIVGQAVKDQRIQNNQMSQLILREGILENNQITEKFQHENTVTYHESARIVLHENEVRDYGILKKILYLNGLREAKRSIRVTKNHNRFIHSIFEDSISNSMYQQRIQKNPLSTILRDITWMSCQNQQLVEQNHTLTKETQVVLDHDKKEANYYKSQEKVYRDNIQLRNTQAQGVDNIISSDSDIQYLKKRETENQQVMTTYQEQLKKIETEIQSQQQVIVKLAKSWKEEELKESVKIQKITNNVINRIQEEMRREQMRRGLL